MGMDIHTYIGPYLEVSGKKTRTVEVKKQFCTKHKTRSQQLIEAKFCSVCGEKMIFETTYKTEKVEPWQTYNEKFDDGLYSPDGIDVFINCYFWFHLSNIFE